MSTVRSRDTKPELALRRAIHAQGVRYRLHPRDVAGTPDLVVRSKKVAVFVDGDLWHGNPAEWERRGRPDLASLFPNRTDFWVQKIQRNIARDLEVNVALRESGWRVVRIWASDVMADPNLAAGVVLAALQEAR